MTSKDEAIPHADDAKRVTVLVYGANRNERLSAQRAIAAHGFRVLLASSRAEAAKCLASGRVRAIVLTDGAAAAGDRATGPAQDIDYDGIPVVRHNPHDVDGSATRSLIAALHAAAEG